MILGSLLAAVATDSHRPRCCHRAGAGTWRRSDRLSLVHGDVGALAALAPVDLVLACHVLYFWRRRAAEVARLHGVVRPGGLLALGYQPRHHMPPPSQRNFPKQGYVLYDSDDAVETLLRGAGFESVSLVVKAPRTCRTAGWRWPPPERR
jgi:Methyltransferase domain